MGYGRLDISPVIDITYIVFGLESNLNQYFLTTFHHIRYAVILTHDKLIIVFYHFLNINYQPHRKGHIHNHEGYDTICG